MSARLAPYAGLPDVGSAWQSLLGKAFSVMRVNALSPEGGITQHWSTPDRTPHRWMWLWDSCYHSLAANLLPDSALPNKTKAGGPNLAWEYLRSVLAGAGPEEVLQSSALPTQWEQRLSRPSRRCWLGRFGKITRPPEPPAFRRTSSRRDCGWRRLSWTPIFAGICGFGRSDWADSVARLDKGDREWNGQQPEV